MIHIVQNSKKKYEVKYTDRKGNLLSGSNQGYENKLDCFKAIRSEMKNCFDIDSWKCVIVQDDTVTPISVWRVAARSKTISLRKPKKRYQPK